MDCKYILSRTFILFAVLIFSVSCGPQKNGKTEKAGREPHIQPDYTDITIPPNIAPMNFRILEKGSRFRVTVMSGEGKTHLEKKSSDGIIKFSGKEWTTLLNQSKGAAITFHIYSVENSGVQKEYNSFEMKVAGEPVDPYLAYRLIQPGYYNWSHIRIIQRSLESFSEYPVIENQILDMNCANCHSFNQYNPDRFMVHIRGSHGGTYIAENGKITKRDPKIENMVGGATYPSWHPNGKYIAFSSNQVRQAFYARPERSIEVFDLVSNLVLYDIEKNDIIQIGNRDTTRYLETFPSWSPDGKYLYFCRAKQINTATTMTIDEIRATKYDLVRKSFDPDSKTFGDAEIVFKASDLGKSVSFPRVSPDGKYLVVTLMDFGTFSIWHKEADLYIINLQTGEYKKMDLNSDDTESYHTWSSNGKWLVFSSKRLDGRSARPFFAYIGSWDKQGKPFVLPQEDPDHYDTMLESFNIPEFIKGKIRLGPRDFASASSQEAVKAKAGNPLDSLPVWEKKMINAKRNPGEKSIHE